jgi:putative transport protein
VDDAMLTGYRPLALRAYRLTSNEVAGMTVRSFLQKYPQYKVVNVGRGEERVGAPDDLVFQKGDVIALGGRLEAITENMGLIGPEVPDSKVLNIPIDQAEILVTNKEIVGKELKEFRNADFAGQIGLRSIERGGVTIPMGLNTKLERFDVLYVSGMKAAVDKLAALAGKIARPSTSTDLLTLALGMILGFLIGAIQFPAFGASVGLGNAGGLLVSGVIVSSVVSRLRFFGNTPTAARNVLEDLGLVVFVSIVGINAGASLLSQLTGAIALKIFVIGFLACSIPPFVVWAIGFHVFKMNAAVLMGGVAGARSHSGPCREAAVEIQSNVPWIGFPVGYAVSGVLLTVFGYFAMVLAQ